MPPRTANSPRRSTRSTRVYAAPTRAAARSSEIDLSADREPYRLQLAKTLDLRLQNAAHRRNHDLRRREIAVARQPPQQVESAADRIRARTQPLVRQRLPSRVVRHSFLPDQGLQRCRQLFCFAKSGTDQEHRATRTPALHRDTQRGGNHRPHRRGRSDVEHGQPACTCVSDGLDNGGFAAEKVDESREGHPERLPAGYDRSMRDGSTGVRRSKPVILPCRRHPAEPAASPESGLPHPGSRFPELKAISRRHGPETSRTCEPSEVPR